MFGSFSSVPEHAANATEASASEIKLDYKLGVIAGSCELERSLLALILEAVWVGRDGVAGDFDRVSEEVLPDGFMKEFAARVFDGGGAGDDAAVGAAAVVFYVGICD